jgi:hypothetical protein
MKTIQRCYSNMKTIILISLFAPILSFAQVTQRTFDAVVRTEDNLPAIEQVVLRDLISHDSFDGEHFRIVKGKSNEAVKFDAEPELTLRAATVYYHLTKAREYFLKTIKSDYVATIPKMTIRIDHSNQFNELGHFANDNYEPQFNNALTIPAGQTPEWVPASKQRKWGMEIWFRPQKKIHLRDLKTNNLATQEFKVLMKGFRDQVHRQSLQQFLVAVVMAYSKDGSPSPFSQEALIRTAGSSLLMEAGYQFFDPITKVFTRKWYWLDTALVPEIIYHEYAHVALSDHLQLSHSTAIIEGMADFFAGKMANSPKLAMNIKKYNTYNGKNAKSKKEYNILFETKDFANTDFVFGVLWALGEIVNSDNSGELFMFNLRKELTTNSSIRHELVEGVLKTCDKHCTSPFVDKIRILKTLNLKGI